MNAKKNKQIRYAVVGLGYIAQGAVLPAFERAKKNSRLTALVSGDAEKLQVLGKKYKVPGLFSYEQYDEFLQSGLADAVYIALPNTMHAEYAVKAAKAGLHVICEKPMGIDEKECEAMIQAAKVADVRLMIAYRLHFNPANLEAIKIVDSGRLGEPRIFHSTFSRQVKKGDIRLEKKFGGGSLWDLGIYCINAARYLFKSEPTQVSAFSSYGIDDRFLEVDEMTSATMRFPGDRLAVFTSSFGAADTSFYEVIGTKGALRVEPAYDYSVPLAYKLTVNEKTTVKKFSKSDQFGGELIYFSECILRGKDPEPSGEEGWGDVKIIRALYASAERAEFVTLPPMGDGKPIRQDQKISLPQPRKPALVNVSDS